MSADLDGGPLAQADRVRKIGVCAPFLSVHFHEAKLGPNSLDEVVQAVLRNGTSASIAWEAQNTTTHLSPSSQLITTV